MMKDASSLSEQAERTKDKSLFEKAFGIYQSSLSLGIHQEAAFANWGGSLFRASKCENSADAIELLSQSFSKLEAAIAVKSNFSVAYSNYLAALLKRYVLEEESKSKDDLLEKALSIKTKLKALSKKGDYNVACLLARIGKHDSAIAELQLCKSDNTLFPKEYILADADFASLHDLPEFVEFLAEI